MPPSLVPGMSRILPAESSRQGNMNRLEAEPLKSLNVFRNFLIADNFCTPHFNKCAWPQPYVKQCRTKNIVRFSAEAIPWGQPALHISLTPWFHLTTPFRISHLFFDSPLEVRWRETSGLVPFPLDFSESSLGTRLGDQLSAALGQTQPV